MAIEARADQTKSREEEDPWAHLRATPEELARLLAAAPVFDIESWQRNTVPPTPEELADLDDFLQELDAMRRQDIQRQDERLARLGE